MWIYQSKQGGLCKITLRNTPHVSDKACRNSQIWLLSEISVTIRTFAETAKNLDMGIKQEGHDGPVSLHWLIGEIPSCQTLQYLRIGLKHKTPQQGLKLVATVRMFCNKKISKDFTI